MKKQVAYLLFLVCLILFATTSQVRAATTENVTLSVHKLLFEDGQVPELQTDGGVLSQKDLPAYRGLNGVTFSLYDVSEQYYSYVKQGLSKEQAQAQVAKLKPEQVLTSGITETQRGEAGIVNFNVPKYKQGGLYDGAYAVYLLIESQTPAFVKERAAPLVVILPITQGNREESTIHLYPKNEEIAYTPPDFRKQVLYKKDSYAYGDTISYQIRTTIPVDSWNYSTYQISDHADSGLVMKAGSLHIKLGNQQSIDYQVSSEKNGFTVDFSPQNLAEFSGENLTISYEMTLDSRQIDQTDFTNTAILTPGNHDVIKARTTVKSGHQVFTKVDLNNQHQGLAGAKFIVQNHEGKSLSRSSHINKWLKIKRKGPVDSLEKQLVVLESDVKGMFRISGLPDGHYQLVEIQAPSGYQLTQTPIDFTINTANPSSAALTVVNQKKEVRWFPKTNDSQKRGLVILGIFIICLAGSMIVFKLKDKRGKKNEKNR